MSAMLNALREEGTKADCVAQIMRLLNEQAALEAENKLLREALAPFARVRTDDIKDEEHDPSDRRFVQLSVSFTRAEAEAFNRDIDRLGLPFRRAVTDPYAKGAGTGWPDHVIDLDGVTVGDFRRARAAIAKAEGGEA